MVKLRQIKGDAKARILDAADAIFVRHGIDGARMQQIADRAGVNKALLHYYFKSKAELARAAWLRFAVVYAPKVFQLLASDLSLEEKIEQYVDAYHAMLTRYPYVLTYVVSEGARRPDFFNDYYTPERRKAARQMVAKLREQIAERVKRKAMAPISAEQFFMTLSSSTLFPYAGGPMLTEALGLNSKEYSALLELRRHELPVFLKKALLR